MVMEAEVRGDLPQDKGQRVGKAHVLSGPGHEQEVGVVQAGLEGELVHHGLQIHLKPQAGDAGIGHLGQCIGGKVEQALLQVAPQFQVDGIDLADTSASGADSSISSSVLNWKAELSLWSME